MSTQQISDIRELTNDEVDAVNGGLVVIAIIAVLIGLLLPQ
jgi:lactobin A/cerein 7B family class IIb bacteriocin